MAKTSAHDEARTARQAETLHILAPNKVGKFSERVLRLANGADFSEAVTTYNAATRISESFDSKADAEELAGLLRGDANVRFAGVSRDGSRWNMNAERFDGPSTDELVRMAADGNGLAFWALYARLLPKIERNATEHGVLSLKDGPGAVFDEDDAHQRHAEILWSLVQNHDFGSSFVGRFDAATREVFHEARRMSKAYTVPQNDLSLVESAVRKHAGDIEAAAEDLAFNPDRSRHVSKDKFYALLSAIDPSRPAEFDPATMDGQVDPTQSDALSSVESGFDNEELGFVWGELTDREREVLSLHFGLDGHREHTTDEISEVLDLSKRRINQLLRSARNTIAGRVNAPKFQRSETAREVRDSRIDVSDPKSYAKARATEGTKAPEFPVQVHTVADEAPAQTVADRRANPQDGVRAPLHIRVVRVDHTKATGILAGNEAWGDSRRRDYDAPKRTKAEPRVDTATTGLATGSPLGEETEARIAAIKARRAARAKAEADDFKNFLKRLGS